MENTFESLQQQIDLQLNQLNRPKNIHINKALSQLLDQFDIPFNAKLACLSIDTSMKHLDRISYYHYERDAILIGDLLSAHYYQLVADLNDIDFQFQMNQAVVKINEIKSNILHQKTSYSKNQLKDAILKIETLLVKVIIDYYQLDIAFEAAQSYIVKHLNVEHLSYLIGWDSIKINRIILTLQNEIKE